MAHSRKIVAVLPSIQGNLFRRETTETRVKLLNSHAIRPEGGHLHGGNVLAKVVVVQRLLIWLIPFPEEWSWLPTWHPGVHPDAYKNVDIWKKPQYVGAQSLSSTEHAASLAATPLTSGQSLLSGRPAPSTALVLSPVAEEQIEPEDTHPTPVMQQRSDVPSQQAFPYVTHTVESESEADTVIARSNFGNTLVRRVCRNMSDKEAHEAVMNKSWFQKVSEHDAPRLQQRMGSSRPLSMTIPAWASKKLQGEAALWFNKKDIGTGPASSSLSSTPTEEEAKYPLHEMIAPSLETIETFLSDEKKERESKLLQRVPSRCHGTCLRLTALHLRPTKHYASTMMRSMHVWWQIARLMRRTLKAIGRVAVETSTDLAFVRCSLHSFWPRMSWKEAAFAFHMQKDAR